MMQWTITRIQRICNPIFHHSSQYRIAPRSQSATAKKKELIRAREHCMLSFFSLFVSILINYCYNYHLLTQYTRWVNRSAKPKCCATYSPMKDMQEHELIFRQPVVLDEIEQNFGNNMQPATGKSVTEKNYWILCWCICFWQKKRGIKSKCDIVKSLFTVKISSGQWHRKGFYILFFKGRICGFIRRAVHAWIRY